MTLPERLRMTTRGVLYQLLFSRTLLHHHVSNVVCNFMQVRLTRR